MGEDQRKFRFRNTTATKKIFQLQKRIRAVSGGTGASKTISILIWLIDYAQSTKNELISVVSESYPHLEKGSMLDFQNIMKDRGYWKETNWNQTKHQYIFETGTVLEFFSSDYAKAHGPRRDVLFLNECQNLEYNMVDQLITRTRKVVWMDWNPTNEFWFYTEMLGRRDDIDFMGERGNYPQLTFQDNEALSNIERQEILSHQDNQRWWNVYGLGKLGEIEGRIYTGWQIIDKIPFEARLERYGLDFGYTNDPTALIALYYYNGGYIVDEILFARGLSNKEIAETLVNLPKALIIADSAEPKSIAEIRSYNVNIIGVSKTRGESKTNTFKKWSIQNVQNQKMSITQRSINIIKEYRNYLWLIDKDGHITNEPDHQFSHSMNAIEYAMTTLTSIIRRKEILMSLPTLPRKPRINPGS